MGGHLAADVGGKRGYSENEIKLEPLLQVQSSARVLLINSAKKDANALQHYDLNVHLSLNVCANVNGNIIIFNIVTVSNYLLNTRVWLH